MHMRGGGAADAKHSEKQLLPCRRAVKCAAGGLKIL